MDQHKDTGRLAIRYRIAMAVEVRQGKTWTTLTSEDVSYGGMFLRTDSPPKLHQLVRLRAKLPFELGPFDASAVVTRSIEPGGEPHRVPGVGLAFYGLGGAGRDQWDRFILEAAATSPALAETPFRAQRIEFPAPPTSLVGPVPVLEVTVSTLGDLFVLHSRDGSRAGIFLATLPDFAPGDRVILRVLHPKTESEFWIPCVVKRSVSARFKGVAVEFSKEDPALLRAFRDSLASLIDEAERS